MESDIGPTIIVAGISIDEATAVLELRRRGFIVKHSVFIDKLNFAVCMSRKLTAKLAAENNIPVQPISKYSLFMQLTLANQAATIILRASAIGAKDCWVAHDKNQHELEAALTTNTISHPNKSLMLINGYYGSQIAMYYGFLAYYTNSLVPPMLVGGLLFFYQTLYNQIDCAWLPAFCLGTTVWSTFFLETWKGRCAELAYAWGVFGWEDKELTAELAKVLYAVGRSHSFLSILEFCSSTNTCLICLLPRSLHDAVSLQGASKEVSSVEVRRSLSAGAMLTLVYVQVQLMLGYNHVQSHAPEYFGTYWYSWLLPSVLYFVLCGGIGAVFHPISRKLNDFEMHPTKVPCCTAVCMDVRTAHANNLFVLMLFIGPGGGLPRGETVCLQLREPVLSSVLRSVLAA